MQKEIYPVGFNDNTENKKRSPKVIFPYLFESLKMAGIDKAFMIIRNGKWDIPTYLCNKNHFQLNLSYLVSGATPSACHTIDFTFPFIKNNKIVFGFS